MITIIRYFYTRIYGSSTKRSAEQKYLAAVVFGIAAATDGLDGYIARLQAGDQIRQAD